MSTSPPIAAKNRQQDFVWLGLILASGFAIRVIAALTFWRPGAIGGEGAEYARIAENFRNGAGYVGIGGPGPEIAFPPLFPLMIGLGSMLLHDYERAGRLVAMLFGVLLPLPVYGVAARLFGRKAAWIAALLVACHPVLIGLSFSVLSEGPYAALLLTAVYLVLRALDDPPGLRNWLFAGATFGLAYLVRQEAVVPMLIAAVFALAAVPGTRALKWKRVAAVIAPFFLLALPEIISLYRITGKLRLEAKSAGNFEIGQRIVAGQDPLEAEYGINGNLEGTGVWMVPGVVIDRQLHVSPRLLALFLAKGVHRNTQVLLRYLSSVWFGAPFLPALACLGLFRQRWRKSNVWRHLYVLLIPVTAILTTFTVIHLIFPRNYFLLIPFLSLWAANGIIGIAVWARASVAAIPLSRFKPILLAGAACGVAFIAVMSYVQTAIAIDTDSGLGEEFGASRGFKEAGLWIRGQQSGRMRIMDLGTAVAFHAEGEHVHFPFTNGATAIRFLDAAKVDYVILRRGFTFTDYYADWLANGIPDPRAKLVFATQGPNRVMVYQWRRN